MSNIKPFYLWKWWVVGKGNESIDKIW